MQGRDERTEVERERDEVERDVLEVTENAAFFVVDDTLINACPVDMTPCVPDPPFLIGCPYFAAIAAA